MKNKSAFPSTLQSSLVFPTDIFSTSEFAVIYSSSANPKYQVINLSRNINQTIKKLFQLYFDDLCSSDSEAAKSLLTTLECYATLEQAYDCLFSTANLAPEVRQLENSTRYYCCLWLAWHCYSRQQYRLMTQYLAQSRNYTSYTSAEMIEGWQSFLAEPEVLASNFAQPPGWQELIAQTNQIEAPKVSVIIPSYNCARYLPQAIESVLEQTYNAYEIIVIDDGSGDNTKQVIEPYLDKIRYLEQVNQGASEARNRGLYLARGELIAFLDADDVYLPHKLQEQVAVFTAQPNIGIVNSGFRIIKDDSEVVLDVEQWREIPELTPEVWLLYKPVLPSAMMFRRQWFEKVGGFEQRFFPCEDMEITFRMVIEGCQSAWLPSVTVCYRRHNDSATSFEQANILRQAQSAEAMQDDFFGRTDLPESIRQLEGKFRFYNYSWLAWRCYESGLIAKMTEYLEKSQSCAPFSWGEMIASWMDTFRNCATTFACDFDAYALSNLPEWQQIIAGIRVSPWLNNYNQKFTQIQELLTYEPDNFEVAIYGQTYYEFGKKLIKQNDLEQALIWLRQAIDLVPQNANYHYELGNAFTALYDLESAIAAYQRAARLNPDAQEFKQSLAATLELQTKWLALTNYCQQVIEHRHQNEQKIKLEQPLKILMIFPFPCYPPQQGGAAIRMFEQLKYFGKRHHLTVVSIVFDEAEYIYEEELNKYCDRTFLVKLGVPMSPHKPERQQQLYFFKVWNMWKTLQQLSKIDFDLVFFDFIFSTTYYSLFADRFTVLNEHNIESQLLQRCAATDSTEIIDNLVKEGDDAKHFVNAQQEAKLLVEYENKTWSKFSLRSVVSFQDKQEIESRCSTGQTLVVKNGIDTQSILPVDNNNHHKILFMGTMSYYPNIDAVLYFVKSILPILRNHHNHNCFCIAGRTPPSNIKALAQVDTSIEVIADPPDMREVAQQCQITVVPLRIGGGTRIKILHSMAMGLPVISTSLGSEGLDVIEGEHLLIRDNPQEFAAAVLEIQSNSELRAKLRFNGRKLVEAKYDWEHILAEYEREIYRLRAKRLQIKNE